MNDDRDAMTLEKARSIAQAVAHRQDGTSQALAMLDSEIEHLTTNANALGTWMNGIDEILGCEFGIDKPGVSSRLVYKCRVCLIRSDAPVRGSAAPCREKVRAARSAKGAGEAV